VVITQAIGNYSFTNLGSMLKAAPALNFNLSYPHFGNFGIEMVIIFSENKTVSFLKIYNEEFCWFRVLLG
jgi:hypothetical protein